MVIVPFRLEMGMAGAGEAAHSRAVIAALRRSSVTATYRCVVLSEACPRRGDTGSNPVGYKRETAGQGTNPETTGWLNRDSNAEYPASIALPDGG